MRAKGFTLIELLAVIVILAIIALIAVPIILNIIGDAKGEATERSKELYLEAVKEAVARKNLTSEFNPTTCDVKSDGNLSCKSGEETVDLIVESTGTRPTGGTVTLEDGVIKGETLVFGGSDMQGDEPQPPATVSFQDDTWETIIENVKNGYGEMYSDHVGETKKIKLGGKFNNKEYTVRLANTSTPAECKNETFSQTACGFVVEFVDIIEERSMNVTNTNVGGWEKSQMRKYLNVIKEEEESGTVFNALPKELQDAIADTRVISSHGKEDQDNFTTTDKLYLLSTKEVYGTEGSIPGYDSATAETRQLDYYKDVAQVTGSSYSGAKKNYEGSAYYWWLRSARSNIASGFYGVTDTGAWTSDLAIRTRGVAPAFRLS